MKSIFPLSYRHVTTLNKGNNSQKYTIYEFADMV